MKIVFVYIDPNFEEIFDFGDFIGLVAIVICTSFLSMRQR